jgi:hypothetical protein
MPESITQQSSAAAGGGLSFGSLLGVLFIALKLTHVINWDWKWVLCPIWAPLVLVVGILVLAGGGYVVLLGIMTLVDGRRKQRAQKQQPVKSTLNTHTF